MYISGSRIGFLNACQGYGGVYVSFGHLKKFYIRFGEHTRTLYLPSVPVMMMIYSENGELLFKTSIVMPENEKFMVTIIGTGKKISVIKIAEPLMPMRFDRAYVRFINLSSFGPAALIQRGNFIFKDIEFCEKTNYILASPGKYSFTIKAPGISKAVEIRAEAGEYKTIYFMGGRNMPKAIAVCDRHTPRRN